MGKYRVELSDGRKYEVEADSKPTEADILSHLGVGSSVDTSKPSGVIPIDPTQLIINPLNLQNIGGLAQREEAAFAGAEMNPDQAFKQFMGGIQGTQTSPVDPNRLTEYGDIDRLAGADEGSAAVKGFLRSLTLPSNLATTAMGSATGLGSKAAKAIKPSQVANTYRNLFQKAIQEAGGNIETAASTLEATSNIPKEAILWGMMRPESLAKSKKAPETLAKVSNELTNRYLAQRPKVDQFLRFNDEQYLGIANQAVNEYKAELKIAGKNLNSLSSTAPRKVPVHLVNTLLDEVLVSNRLTLDDADKPLVKWVTSLQKSLKKVQRPGSEGMLNVDELRLFQQDIADEAFSHAKSGLDGITIPEPKIARAEKSLYSQVRGLIRTIYADNKPLLNAFDRYSDLAHVRSDVARTIGQPEKLAKFIRKYDLKNPEDLNKFTAFLEEIPSGVPIKKRIEDLMLAKEKMPASILKFLDSNSPNEIERGLTRLFEKPLHEIGPQESGALDEFFKVLNYNPEQIIDLKVAQEFNAKFNLFRGAALVGTLGGAMGGGPVGAALGGASGVAVGNAKILKPVIRYTASLLQSHLLKKLLESKGGKLIKGGGRLTGAEALKKYIQEKEINF